MSEEHGNIEPVALDAVGDIAADFIEELLDIADLDGDIEIDSSHGRATVTVHATDRAALGRLSDPETVSALQDLTRLAVQAKTGHPARLLLDIGGSRDQRTSELEELVQSAAARLATGAQAVHLPPMSSYERKLVHDFAAGHGLHSESEGEGAERHTVLSLASE